ncbi:MAG TPA: DUF1800 domain-containing protein [Cytophagaceae bacterium]|nr:DUF1800 domain-containing protein [Cytophagaceae bacterium]
MKKEYIYSLRLGFTGEMASLIESKGIEKTIQNLLNNPLKTDTPVFILSESDAFEQEEARKALTEEQKKEKQKDDRKRFFALQAWWLNKMYTSENPLQEKMVFFWHNHFVSSFQKVKSSTLMFNQNKLFRQYAFGNFKELAKEMLYNNAMIIYLDNKQNKVGKPNENLSRELLELFTLGIGNYTEGDIKEGARALAGLTVHLGHGQYNPKREDNGIKNYLNKTGNLKAEDMINAIFEHPRAAYLLTEKLLNYFLTDNPEKELIEEYAIFFRKSDYELKPFLKKLFTDNRFLNYNGSKIKDPITFLLQTFREFNLEKIPARQAFNFLRNQGLELMNPPNVKGWDGGKAWLDSGKLIARNSAVNALLSKRFVPEKAMMNQEMQEESSYYVQEKLDLTPQLNWNKNDPTNVAIISEFTERLLFQSDNEIEDDMERIVKYDFDPKNPGAQEVISQLVRFIMKTPNYQIV